MASSGPDITFGMRSSVDQNLEDTRANTSAPLEESKEESKGPFTSSQTEKSSNEKNLILEEPVKTGGLTR